MGKTAEAGALLDRRDLLLYLHSLANVAPTADRTLHLGLRAIHRHFGTESAVVARLDPDGKPGGKQRRYPKKPQWSEQDLLDLRGSALADLPRGEIFALLRRKHRNWALLALRRFQRPFDAADLDVLKEAARILSGHLDRIDAVRVGTTRERIDRKLIEPIRPNDLFYQVLHGLRSLTGYDHSASLYMLPEPLPLPYPDRFPVDVQIVAELLGPNAKSPRVGQEHELDPALVALLGSGDLIRGQRTDEEWRTRSGRAGAELAATLDSRDDLGKYGRERSMICAPLISQDSLVGILKVGFRHPGQAGSYEADLVADFVPHVIVALRNLHRLEHLQDELDAARKFQRSLLPPFEHAIPGGTVSYRYRPCDQLGGDFFDLLSPAPDCTRLLLADVSGHGAKAAMLTALIKATFHDKSRTADPGAILREIWANVRYLDPELMVTAICLDVDLRARVLRWGNAGHPAPLLLAPDGGTASLDEGEPPIFASTEFRWHVYERPLPPRGTMLLLTTDGLLEAEPGDGDEFGVQRLVSAVRGVRDGASADGPGDDPDATPAQRLDRAFRAVDAHRAGALQMDDYTAVLAAITD